ncbi:hypothetical protein BHL51_18065 [Bacillus cereus]|nr:hypothetical protein BHL51_18065 [Bacillus cereus]
MKNTNKSYGLLYIEGLRESKPIIIYQRFFKYIYHNLKYINDSTKNINLPTNSDIKVNYNFVM